MDEILQLFESRQFNDGIGDNGCIEGFGVAHPSRHQHFGHGLRHNTVVLDPMEGLRPISRDELSGKGMKRIVNDEFLWVMMGSMR